MRLVFTAFAFSCLVLFGSACDMTAMPGNIAGMSDKMDQTNSKLDSTGDKMDQTNKTLGVVAGATHDQIMAGGLASMITDDATRVLVPVPFGMLPGGKIFAEEAHEDDLMDWFYAQYKDLTEGTADDGQRISISVFSPKIDSTGHEVLEAQYAAQTVAGKPYMVPRTSWEFPSSYFDSFNHQKDILLNEMQVVAYFIPQPMIEQIVADQIVNGGMREQTAFLILNLRDVFARGAELANGLYTDKLIDLKQVAEALRIVNLIDYVAHLPCTDQIKKTKIRGYLDLSTNYIYEQQALQSALSSVVPVLNPATPFVPVSIPFDLSQSINNEYQTYYTVGSDGMTVTPIDQSAARTAEITYDASAYKQDWKDLKRHFQSDLSKDDQQSEDGQAYLTEIENHL